MFFQTVYALDDSILGETLDFGEFVLLSISMFVLFAGIFSIVFILRGGLLLILSGGKDDKIKPAINTIRYAVVGIVVTVLTIFLFPVFGGLLGLDVEQYAQPKKIFEKIGEIGNRIFGEKSSYNSGVNIDINDIDDYFPSDFSDL